MLMETVPSVRLIIISRRNRTEKKFAASEIKFGMKSFRIAPVLMDRLIKESDAQGIVQQESISTESASTASTSVALLVHTLIIIPVSSDASATTRTRLLEFSHIQKEDATPAVGLILFHILIRVIRQILIAASQIITGFQESVADARI